MIDQPESAASITNVSGGANLDAQRDISVGGDVIGRDKIIQIVENISDPALKRIYLRREISRVESEIDDLENDSDNTAQQLTYTVTRSAFEPTTVVFMLFQAAYQWVLHLWFPKTFRHASEISRLKDAQRKRQARIEDLKVYLKELNEFLTSL
jgi:hypothetical protein